MEPILLSISDACRSLGIGRSKLYELIGTGELSVRKLGRKSLIPREDIASFAAQLPTGRPKAEAA